MPVYTSEVDTLLEIKKRFKKEGKLNRAPSRGCLYAPRFNSIGCAVGCLFSYEDALRCDRDGITIREVHELLPEIYSEYFSDDLLHILNVVQELHDEAHDYNNFMSRLDAVIKELKKKRGRHENTSVHH